MNYVRFRDAVLQPHPHTRGGPPILIGGNSDFAIRRALRRGDGWIGVGTRYDDPEPLLARVHAALDKERRPRNDGFQVKLSLPYSPKNSDDDLLNMVRTVTSLGLHELVLQLPVRAKFLESDMRRWSGLLGLTG